VEEGKDDFGNFFDRPFEELWNADQYRIARTYLKNKDLKAANNGNVCVSCRHSGLINIDILSCHSFFDSL
jgi:hypothetical protein